MLGRRTSIEQQEPVDDTRRAGVDRREDYCLAKKSLKIIRLVCKDYGLSFKLPEGSTFKRSRHGGERAPPPPEKSADGLDSPRSISSSTSHASSFEFSSAEEDPDTSLNFRPSYNEVSVLLRGAQVSKRVHELKAIHLCMQESSDSAQRVLAQMDDMEASNMSRTRSVATPDTEALADEDGDMVDMPSVVNHGLRRFAIQGEAVALAVQRCIDTMPKLEELARHKARMQRNLEIEREEAKLIKEQEEEAQAETELGQGFVAEVEARLRELGDLDADAHPELAALLQAQKEEARSLARQIQEGERDVQVKSAALAVVEGRVDEGASLDIMGSGIKAANEMRAAMFEEKKEEAERLARQEGTGLPTDEEVQVVLAESERLKLEAGRMDEQIRKMREHTEKIQAAAKAAEDELAEGFRPLSVLSSQRGVTTPTWSVRSGTGLTPGSQRTLRHRDTVAEINARLQLPLERAGAILQEALVEKEAVEKRIADEDARIAAAESHLKTAGESLMTLEEAKIVYLEQLGHDHPKVLQDFIAEEAEKASHSDSDGLGSDSDSDFGKDSQVCASSDVEVFLDPARTLADEEATLRGIVERLETATSDEEEAQEDARPGGVQRARTVDGLSAVGTPSDVIVLALHRLMGKLRTATALARGEEPPADAVHDGGKVKDPEWEALRGLSREEAGDRLRQLPAQDIRELLGLERRNAEYMSDIGEKQAEIDFLRAKCGASKDLLGPTGVYSAEGPPDPDEAPSETLVLAVRRKARDLQAMRKQWWFERQRGPITVRRALAATSLPEGEGVEDDPPSSILATAAERVWDSMTMP